MESSNQSAGDQSNMETVLRKSAGNQSAIETSIMEAQCSMEQSYITDIVLNQSNQSNGEDVSLPQDPRATWWLSIGQYLSNDLQSSLLCDLALQGRDGVVMAHCVVMAAVSPVICAHVTMMTARMVTFDLPEVSYTALTQLVDYVYHGSIELARESVQGFLSVTNTLGLSQVKFTVVNVTNSPQTADLNVCHMDTRCPQAVTNQNMVRPSSPRMHCSHCPQWFTDVQSYDQHIAMGTCQTGATGLPVGQNIKKVLHGEKKVKMRREPGCNDRDIAIKQEPEPGPVSFQQLDAAEDNPGSNVELNNSRVLVEKDSKTFTVASLSRGRQKRQKSKVPGQRKKVLQLTKLYKCATCQHSFTNRASLEKHFAQATCQGENVASHSSPEVSGTKPMDAHLTESDQSSELVNNSDSDFDDNEDVPEEDQNVTLRTESAHSPKEQFGKWEKVVHALLIGENGIKCPKCGLKQEGLRSFETHLRNTSDHREDQRYVQTAKLKVFEEYKKSDDFEKYIALIKNDTTYLKSLNLEQFMKQESPNNRHGNDYTCHVCEREFSDRNKLRHHIYNRHKILCGYRCLKCDRKIRKRTECLSHIADHIIAEKFNLPLKPIFLKYNRCFFCDQCFSTEEEAISHGTVCKEDQWIKICPICGIKCMGQYANSSLHNHIRKQHIKGSQTCQICNAKVMTMSRHMKNVHAEKQQAPVFVCSQCGKSFNRRDNLRVHERIHTGDKPFSCSLCGQQFRLKCLLKTHKEKHV